MFELNTNIEEMVHNTFPKTHIPIKLCGKFLLLSIQYYQVDVNYNIFLVFLSFSAQRLAYRIRHIWSDFLMVQLFVVLLLFYYDCMFVMKLRMCTLFASVWIIFVYAVQHKIMPENVMLCNLVAIFDLHIIAYCMQMKFASYFSPHFLLAISLPLSSFLQSQFYLCFNSISLKVFLFPSNSKVVFLESFFTWLFFLFVNFVLWFVVHTGHSLVFQLVLFFFRLLLFALFFLSWPLFL